MFRRKLRNSEAMMMFRRNFLNKVRLVKNKFKYLRKMKTFDLEEAVTFLKKYFSDIDDVREILDLVYKHTEEPPYDNIYSADGLPELEESQGYKSFEFPITVDKLEKLIREWANNWYHLELQSRYWYELDEIYARAGHGKYGTNSYYELSAHRIFDELEKMK